jgi:hypothetical protein
MTTNTHRPARWWDTFHAALTGLLTASALGTSVPHTPNAPDEDASSAANGQLAKREPNKLAHRDAVESGKSAAPPTDHRTWLVREAMAIADAAWEEINGAPHERPVGGAVESPRRADPGSIGPKIVHETR